MTSREYNVWQQWFKGLRKSWRPCYSDVLPDRPRDYARVGETEAIEWTSDPRTLDLMNDEVRLPRDPVPWRTWDTMQGRPVQMGHPTKTMKVRASHKDHGVQEFVVPAPNDGPLWVEDFPRPLWSQIIQGTDRHAIVIGRNTTCEMIGVSTISGTIQCASAGVWDNSTGALLDGRPVIACRRQLAPMLLGRADVMNVIPHRLAITVRGSDRDPRHFPWLNDWIALDPKKVPTDLPREARVLADMLCTHGAIVGDHGGVTNLSVIAGANWNGIDWGGWAPKLSDFRRVTSPA